MRLFRHKITRGGKSVKSKKWYAEFYTPTGKRCRLPLFEKERISRRYADKIADLLALKQSGELPGAELQRWINDLPQKMLSKLAGWELIDSTRAAAAMTLQSHLTEYRDYLNHKGTTPKYADKVHNRAKAILDGCKFRTLADVSASRIQAFLADEIDSGRLSRKTCNHYLAACKGFFKWLCRDGRAHTNPTEHLANFDTAQDDPRQRRAITPDEMRRLLAVTAAGQDRRSISGIERAFHYETAAMTGLRAAELRALTVADFDFDSNVVKLAGRYTKNRKAASIPLKPDFSARLKAFFSGKLPTAKAFKTPTPGHEMQLLRKDLKAAGIAEVDDEGRVFDFHSFRVFYASMLAESGTNPKTAMELLRHSDIRLTMNIYSMAYRESLTAAVDTLPDLTGGDVQQAKKTGTYDTPADAVSRSKFLSDTLSAPSNGKRNSAKLSEIHQDAQNAAKQGIQGNIPHSTGQKRDPLFFAQKGGRGDSNPRPPDPQSNARIF